MHCGACDREVHPSIEHWQTDKGLVYKNMCPCGAVLGVVENWRSKPVLVPATATVTVPPVQGNPLGTQLPTQLVQGQVTLLEKPDAQTVIDKIQIRLAYLQDGHIEMEIAERKMLRRMLAASTPKPRGRSNVVPIAPLTKNQVAQ